MPKTTQASSFRDVERPVRCTTRTFRPNYLSFAPTYQCNLACPHCCVPIEWTDRLDIATAIRFLEQAHAVGINLLGFTGGEPFLAPEFLIALTQRAAELGFRFDKLMSNGVWFADEDHLVRVLTDLCEAGFSGKLGLSVDKFHGMDIAKLAAYCRIARRVFQRDSLVSLSYASRTPDQGLEPIRRLAAELDAVIDWSPLLGRYLLVSDEFTMTLNWNHLATVERAQRLPGNPWDGAWFAEDYCEGPGQALIVNPRGEVKPCCGFASDLDQLTIGNIYQHTVEEIIERGRSHPYVGRVFRDGLTAIRDDILNNDPAALPGATSNHCYFCWYVLTTNLVALPTDTPQRRLSLPLAGEGAGPPTASRPESATAFLMAFDGTTVFLRQSFPADLPRGNGRTYLVRISGSPLVELPAERMSWTEYQDWINRLRAEGRTLTTHNLASCSN
jgi:MoaA/NifB/PqqE/SkfB family radical SAM enzyme